MAATAASTGHLQLASLSWFLYDWAIRFAKELDFLRTHPWSFTKSLYLFIRYITLALLVGETVVSVGVGSLSQTRCTTFVSVRTAGTFVILIAAFGATHSCISKLYNGSRRVRRTNAALCAAAIIVAVVLEGIFSARIHDIPTNGTCFTPTQRMAAVSWIAPLCFTLYMLILAALKFPSQLEALGPFEFGTLPKLFGFTSLPCLALLPASLLTLILLRAVGSASVDDGGISLVQAAAAISATRLLAGSISNNDVSSLLDPQPTRPPSAHFELGSMRHRAKDSYWSQQETLVTAISPRSAVFPADVIEEEFEFPKKRSSRLATPISPDDTTVTLDLETEHARNRALLVSAIVTHAELPYDLELGDGDDDSSFNIVDGAEMTGMSPDRDTPPRRLSAATPRRNSSRASLTALSKEMVESG